MRTGQRWAPARLLTSDVVVLCIGLASVALIRGLDYSTGDDSRIASTKPVGVHPVLVGIEAAFPLWVWGVAVSTGATLLILGMVTRSHFLVWCGHVALSALYLGLCVGLVSGYLGRPWFDGIRSGAGLAIPALLHFLFWMRMGAQPTIGRAVQRGDGTA